MQHGGPVQGEPAMKSVEVGAAVLIEGDDLAVDDDAAPHQLCGEGGGHLWANCAEGGGSPWVSTALIALMEGMRRYYRR